MVNEYWTKSSTAKLIPDKPRNIGLKKRKKNRDPFADNKCNKLVLGVN